MDSHHEELNFNSKNVISDIEFKEKNQCSNRIFIKNVPNPEYNAQKIRNIFSRGGEIIECYVDNKKESNITYALVRYKTTKEALNAIKMFDGFDLGHKVPLKVCMSKEKDTNVNYKSSVIGTMNGNVSAKKTLKCHVCGIECYTKCGKCKIVAYCGSACQKMDFVIHRTTCQSPKTTISQPPAEYDYSDFHDCYSIQNNIHVNSGSSDSISPKSQPTKFNYSENLNNPYLTLNEKYSLKILSISSKKYFYAIPEIMDVDQKLGFIKIKISKIPFNIRNKIEKGKMYCVRKNDQYLRAVILSQLHNGLLQLRLLDIGSKIFSNYTEISEITEPDILAIPPMCVCCCFEDIATFDKFFPDISINLSDHRITCKLVSTKNNMHVFRSTTPSMANKQHSLTMNEVYDMVVSAFESWNDFSVRSSDPISRFLYNSFIKSYSEIIETCNNVDLEFFEGEIIRYKSSDDKWRRAIIVGMQREQFEISFIDSGDFHVVSKNSIAKVPPFHKYIPPLRFHCSLSPDCEEAEKESISNFLRKFRDPINCKLKILDFINGYHIVKIVDIDRLNAPHQVSIQRTIFNEPTLIKYKTIQVPNGADLRVCVCHFVSVREFYVQIVRKDYAMALKNLNLIIEDELKNTSNIHKLSEITVGMPVLCFNETGGWFRSLILEKRSEKSCSVMYVDFGIIETVKLKSLSMIQPKFLFEPAQAVPCCIDDSQLSKHPNLVDILKSGTGVSINLIFCACTPTGTFK
ncbi:hypothetical protein HZS_4977, partial [Henneguya salminicola]